MSRVPAAAAAALTVGLVVGGLAPAAHADVPAPSSTTPLAASRRTADAQMSFNLQYLQLQSQMQNENRSYTAVSNIMKTQHDAVQASIANLR